MHVLMRDERRKEERSKQGQTNKQSKAIHVHVLPGCAVLLCLVCLFVCLFDLACFFLSSFSSLIKNMYSPVLITSFIKSTVCCVNTSPAWPVRERKVYLHASYASQTETD